jgi:hypothetical protein
MKFRSSVNRVRAARHSASLSEVKSRNRPCRRSASTRNRILSVENDLFYLGAPQPEDALPSLRKSGLARQVNAFREEARNIDLISRYETRLMRNSGRLMEEIRTLRAERAKSEPGLVYDDQTDPAASWYRRLLAQAKRIAAAREQAKHKESKTAKQATQAAESTPPSKISFGNNPTSAPPESPETSPQRPKIPQPIRNPRKSLETAAA